MEGPGTVPQDAAIFLPSGWICVEGLSLGLISKVKDTLFLTFWWDGTVLLRIRQIQLILTEPECLTLEKRARLPRIFSWHYSEFTLNIGHEQLRRHLLIVVLESLINVFFVWTMENSWSNNAIWSYRLLSSFKVNDIFNPSHGLNIIWKSNHFVMATFLALNFYQNTKNTAVLNCKFQR